MQKNIDELVEKYIDIVKDVVKEKQVRSIKQYHKNKEDGYRTISCVLEYEKYKVRFTYHVNEGVVFKKGIVTMYFNIKDTEYHFSDVLAQIAPKDKDCIVFPYIDNEETIRYCINFLWEKLVQYNERINELSENDEQREKLEKALKKEIKLFSGKELPKAGPLRLILSGIYANTALIKYTSKPYEYYINGNYSKALKLYSKESTLALYEQQLVKLMKRAIKIKKKVEIPEQQKTINHVRDVKKSSMVYTILSFILLLPVMFVMCLGLSKIFTYGITKNAIFVLSRNILFLIVPTIFLSLAFTKVLRNRLFKKMLEKMFQFEMLYNTAKRKKFKLNAINSIVIASIVTIAIFVASSISFRDDGIKYSKDILDFKGTIIPYSEVDELDIEKNNITLKNGEKILLDTFSYTIDDLKYIQEIFKNKL